MNLDLNVCTLSQGCKENIPLEHSGGLMRKYRSIIIIIIQANERITVMMEAVWGRGGVY